MKSSIRKHFGLLTLLTSFFIFAVACNSNSAPASNPSSNPNSSADANGSGSAKRYPLKGKVVSIDERGHMVNVDSEAIPGFMDAMTMPYVVKPADELSRLHPGDSITADIVVQGDNNWLENIKVTAPTTPAMTKPMSANPSPKKP
jgi:protein SCO1